MKRVLVSGFGPFLDVADNPSALLAKALSATSHVGWKAYAVELPTSYRRAMELIDQAAGPGLGFDLVLALGVGRGGLRLEQVARGVVGAEATDIDGESWVGRELGPDRINPLPLQRWVDELGGVELSTDCGGYVCNAMNHHILGAWPGRSLFVHVPRGLESDPAGLLAVCDRLARLVSLALAHLEGTGDLT